MALRILIADDNDAVRGLVGETLRGHDGWEVCAEVENGQQAVVKARELKPDLIVLDLAMPLMDGLRATREIVKILPSIPIVIYTLHYAEWVEREAMKAGARVVISKSDSTKLAIAIEELLRERSQQGPQSGVSAVKGQDSAEGRANAVGSRD